MSQLIQQPARVIDRSQTLIDHIITNKTELYNIIGVIEVGISDHALTYAVRKNVEEEGTCKIHMVHIL